MQLSFSFSFLVSLLILSFSGFSFFISNLSVFDSVLPFDPVDKVLLFPVIVLLFMIFVPKFIIFFSYLGDFLFKLIKSDFLVFFPRFILFIMTIFFFTFDVLFSSQFLNGIKLTFLRPVMC